MTQTMPASDTFTYEEVDRIRSRDLRLIGEMMQAERNIVEHLGRCAVRAEQLEDANAALIAAHGVFLKEILAEARRYAAMYEPHSDERNTFAIFAEWAESRAKMSSANA